VSISTSWNLKFSKSREEMHCMLSQLSAIPKLVGGPYRFSNVLRFGPI